MGRDQLLTLACLALCVAGAAVYDIEHRRERLAAANPIAIRPTANDVAIRAAVAKYFQALRPGLTREEVKSYLRAQGVSFFERCCDVPNGPDSVLIKVGEDEKPWYCSEFPNYLDFEFTAPQAPLGADVLKGVHLTSNGEGCL